MNSKDFLKEGFVEDAHIMHQDHEVQMAREECYHAAENAIALHKLLRNISEQQGLEGWVAAKITLAGDYLKTVREYLEYELMSAASNQTILPVAESSKTILTKKRIQQTQEQTTGGMSDSDIQQRIQPRNTNLPTDPEGMRKAGLIPAQDYDASIKSADAQNTALAKAASAGFPTYQHQGQTYGVANPKYGKGGTTEPPKPLTPQQAQDMAGTNIRTSDGSPVTAGHKMKENLRMAEMDKSARQPGRDGRISHKTYGSRGDEDPGTGPEKVVKVAKPTDVKKSSRKELEKSLYRAYKKSVAEGWRQDQYKKRGINSIMDLVKPAMQEKKSVDGWIDSIYSYIEDHNMKNDPRWLKAKSDAEKMHTAWFVKNNMPTANTNPKLARQGDVLKYKALIQNLAKEFGEQGVAEGKKCNHTMEGTKCPVHGLAECPTSKSRALAEWKKEQRRLKETTAGSVAGVVNPTPKNKAKVGTLFGGTYKQKKSK